MTKLLDCPECGDKDCPVRDDALVCSPKCRLSKWRRKTKEVTAKLDNKGEIRCNIQN